jgi:hypothetical protein
MSALMQEMAAMNVSKKYTDSEIDTELFNTYKDSFQMYTNRDPMSRSVYYMTDIARLSEGYETVISGMLSNELHVINSKIFPPVVSDKKQFATRFMEYLPSLPTPTPEEGINRSIAKIMSESTTRLRRYGSHFRMTSEVAQEEEGQAQANENLVFISGQMVLNAAFLGMEAFASRLPEEDERLYAGLNIRHTYAEKIVAHKEAMFLVYKEKNGFPLAFQNAKEHMMTYYTNEVPPTDVIIPMGKRTLLISNTQYTDFDKAGPLGQQRLWEDAAFINRIVGLDAWEAPKFPEGESYEQLNHTRRIGIYYWFRQIPNMLKATAANGYTGKEIGFGVLDFQAECERFISLYEICSKFPGFKKSHPNNYDDEEFEMDWDWVENNLMDHTPATKLLCPFYEKDGPSVKPRSNIPSTWQAKDVLKHFDFLGCMPLCGVVSQDGYMAVAGPGLGRTVFSKPIIRIGEDAGNMTKQVTYNAWMGVHMTNRKYKYIMQDLFLNGMLPGFSTRIMSKAQIEKVKQDNFNLQGDKEHPGMYLMAIPVGTFEERSYMELLGRNHFESEETRDWEGCDYYSHAYGYDQTQNYLMFDQDHDNIATVMWHGEMTYTDTHGNKQTVPSKTPFGTAAGCNGIIETLSRGKKLMPRLCN